MVLGQASTVPAKMKAYLDYDFIIWIAEKEFERYTEARTALIDHELCHCIGFEDKWKIRGHDVEEFNEIIERYGLWRSDLILADDAIERWKQGRLIELGGKVESALKKLNEMGAEVKVEKAEPEPEEPAQPKSRDEQIDDLLSGLNLDTSGLE